MEAAHGGDTRAETNIRPRWVGRKRRAEADCLLEQIAKKAEEAKQDHGRDLRCFLEHRFKEPLLKYGARGPLYGRAFTYLSLAVVAAGFASSAISADKTTAEDLRWLIIVLGILVALFTGINQFWKPGLRSVGSYRAGNSLRREGWDFVFDRGRYHGVPDAFDQFLDQVREIQTQVDAIDEIQAEVTGTSGTTNEKKDNGTAENPDDDPPSGGS